jgi:hypothetical protein
MALIATNVYTKATGTMRPTNRPNISIGMLEIICWAAAATTATALLVRGATSCLLAQALVHYVHPLLQTHYQSSGKAAITWNQHLFTET